jgi:hypothetical protein
MKLSNRDRFLALILPALFVAMIYGFFWFKPRQEELNKAQIALEDARAKAPGLRMQVQQKQGELAVLKQKMQATELEMKKVRQEWDAAAGLCANPRLRNDRIEKLNGVLARRGLRMIEDGEADGTKDDKPSPTIDSLGEQLAKLSSQPKPQLRKIKVIGRYLDVLAALTDLAGSDVVAVPVVLRMNEAPMTAKVREWVLLVWI